MYALAIDAPMSFPHLFIRSLIEVHRSSSSAYALFFPVFIHRILLHLGLESFPAFEPMHIIALISVTFLRQRIAQIQASFKCPRVDASSSGIAPPPPPPSPSSSVDPTADAYVDPTAAAAPPLSTSDDSDIRHMLETVMTVQAAHGQLLVDMLDELRSL